MGESIVQNDNLQRVGSVHYFNLLFRLTLNLSVDAQRLQNMIKIFSKVSKL